MALQWHKKTFFGLPDVDNFFYGLLKIILKCEIRMGDPTMWIIDEAG